MLRIVSVSGAAILASTAAFAADDFYYTPGPSAAPEASYGYDWSGTYVGFHGGLDWSDVESDFALAPGGGGTTAFELDGGEVGAHLGHNWQNGALIYGVGIEGTWFDLDGSGGISGGGIHSAETSLLLNGTGRVGYAINHYQPYLVGGLSILDYEYTLSDPASGLSETKGDTTLGAALGGGLEIKVSRDVSLFGEFRHYWFDGESNTYAGPGAVTTQSIDPDLDFDTVRGGINWRF